MPSLHAVFNQKLLDFIDDIGQLRRAGKARNVPGFEMLRPGVALASAADVTQPHAIFKMHVVDRYGPRIMSKDEAFFLQNASLQADVSTAAASAGMAGIGAGLDVVQILRSTWSELNTEEKDAIWKHLQLLVLLSNKIS
jgi:hypothetical protein